MIIEKSLEEMLMDAIGAGRVRGVQFKRGWSDNNATFEDLCRVVEDRLTAALRVARDRAYQVALEEFREARRR